MKRFKSTADLRAWQNDVRAQCESEGKTPQFVMKQGPGGTIEADCRIMTPEEVKYRNEKVNEVRAFVDVAIQKRIPLEVAKAFVQKLNLETKDPAIKLATKVALARLNAEGFRIEREAAAVDRVDGIRFGG